MTEMQTETQTSPLQKARQEREQHLYASAIATLDAALTSSSTNTPDSQSGSASASDSDSDSSPSSSASSSSHLSSRPLLLLERASLNLQLQRYEAALNDARRVIELDDHSHPHGDSCLVEGPHLFHAHKLEAECLMGLSRFDEAERAAKEFIAKVQQREKEAKNKNKDGNETKKPDGDGSSGGDGSSESTSSVLPSSIVLREFLPLLRLLPRFRRESSAGAFDALELSRECLMTLGIDPNNDDDATAIPRRANLTPLYPAAHLARQHAEYVHPMIKLGVRIEGAGLGIKTIAYNETSKAQSSENAAAKSYASADTTSTSHSSSSPPSSTSTTSSPSVCIPSGTLIMVSKPLLFVLGSELIPGEINNEDESDDNDDESSMTVDGRGRLRECITERIRFNPTLLTAMKLLDAGPKFDAQRREHIDRVLACGWSSDVMHRLAASNPVMDAPSSLDWPHLDSILSRNTFNPSGVNDAAGASLTMDGAMGLWLLPSLFNHSCHPNVIWMHYGDIMMLRTIRDVGWEEELTIGYVDTASLTYNKRQKVLQQLGFRCRCQWCRCYTERPQLADIEENLAQHDSTASATSSAASSSSSSSSSPPSPFSSLWSRFDALRPQLTAASDPFSSSSSSSSSSSKLLRKSLMVKVESLMSEWELTLAKQWKAIVALNNKHDRNAPACGKQQQEGKKKGKRHSASNENTDSQSMWAHLTQLTSSSVPVPCLSLTHLYPHLRSRALLISHLTQLRLLIGGSTASLSSMRSLLDDAWRTLAIAGVLDSCISGSGSVGSNLVRFDAMRYHQRIITHIHMQTNKHQQQQQHAKRHDDDPSVERQLHDRVVAALLEMVRLHLARHGVKEHEWRHFQQWYGPAIKRANVTDAWIQTKRSIMRP